MSNFKQYRRKYISEMRPYVDGKIVAIDYGSQI